MRAEIKSLHQRLKTTTIYVTHDQVEAMTMADRIVVMRDGHIEQIGTPLDLYDNPRNLFVASFIGSPAMNFIEGLFDSTIFKGQGGIEIALDRPFQSGKGVAGIRPNKLRLGSHGPQAKVLVVEPTGDETHLLVEAGGLQLAVLIRDRIALHPGEVINLEIDPADVHFFDAATGLRMAQSG